MSVTQLLGKVRAAGGWPLAPAEADGRSAVLLEGDSEELGAPGRYSLLFTASGKFVERVEGELRRSVGFDGKSTWASDASGIARRLVFEEAELAHLPAAVLTHSWLAAQTPLAIARDGEEIGEGGVLLGLRLADGKIFARLLLDRVSLLPRSLSVPETSSGEQRWELQDYRRVDGIMLVHRIVHTPAPGVSNVYSIHTARRIAAPPAEAFLPAPSRPRQIRFAGAGEPFTLERAWTGHVLVRPRINGRDLGAFILDTGAAVTLVTRQAAEAAGMASFGRTYIAGAGERITPAALRRCESVDIGGAALTDLVLVEADLAPVSAGLRQEVAGVIGYDLFARCIAEIDLAGNSLALHDSGSYKLEGAGWEDLTLHRKHPLLRCRFEGGREALFLWDTGAGNNPVLFTAPAVTEWRLLEGRETQAARTMGAGGLNEARIGKIGYIELAGQRFDDPVAVFVPPQRGALGDPYIAGIIGNSLVAPFKVVLNYPEGKIAFVKRRGPSDGATATAASAPAAPARP